ncbi:MAG: ComF family protein [Slackia sp.]|nr:ComF family protein [Slackia sp.]
MASFFAQALAETLWPTRCVLCDVAGSLLCADCMRALPFIDFYQACPVCGAPWGRIQCDSCNAVARQSKPIASPCRSCLEYNEASARIVKTYKDNGEQRLCSIMASMMARIVDPSWIGWAQAVTFVPATPYALRKRGFDHARLLAQAFARETGLACIGLVEQAHAADQRRLDRAQRALNIAGRFRAPRAAGFDRVIVIDDVTTTGATLAGAQEALARVQCASKLVTFARV